MLQIIESPELTRPNAERANTAPEAAALAHLLDDCCHPRAPRLRARLSECPAQHGAPSEAEADHLRQLRAEVKNLITLAFGLAEAERRLQTLQS